MKIENLTPDAVVIAELGERLARIRKQQGYSQDELATEAGLGVATLRRIEAGEGSQFESWIKLLKALRMAPLLNSLLPENYESPMAQVLSSSKKRKSGPKGRVWGDERK